MLGDIRYRNPVGLMRDDSKRGRSKVANTWSAAITAAEIWG